MDRETIVRKFETLNYASKDGKRAPHKPLLVVYAIAELMRGKDRLLPYSEINKVLGELLSEFGTWRSRHNTQYPFWRLQSDGVWEVPDADRVRLTASGDAFKSDLIEFNIRGGFAADIAIQLRTDPALVTEVIRMMLDGHFPRETLQDDILKRVGIELTSTGMIRHKRDPNFRPKILKAYEYQCAVCGFDLRLGQNPVALEAAHIKWHHYGGPDLETNGLALCSLHHRLFDRGAFTLSSDFNILVSKNAKGTVGLREWLTRFHGKKLNFPQLEVYHPNETFALWHFKEVFKGDYRER